MKSKECVAPILFVIILIFLVLIMSYVEAKQWNDGYCINCGTKYESISRSGSQTYYECPNCRYGCYY